MVRAITALLVILTAASLTYVLIETPGSVSAEWLGYRIDAHIGVVILAIAAVVVALTLLVRLISAVLHAPRAFSESRRRRRRDKGFEALSRGFLAVAAGDAADARRQARSVADLAGETSLALLLTAQAAQLDGNAEQAQQAFKEMQKRPDAAFLGLRGLLTIALRDGKEAEALAYAEDAYRLRPQTPWVVQTLFDLQVRQGQWLEAQTTLRFALRDRAVPDLEAKRKKAILLLIRADEAETQGNLDEARTRLKEAHTLAPALAPVAIKYAEILHRLGNPRKAAKTIEQTWAVEPSRDLAVAYLTLKKPADTQSRMRAVQRLQRLAPEHLESALAVAEAAILGERWTEARAALDKARDIGTEAGLDARTCALMSRLEEGERGDVAEARAWLLRATEAKPAVVWHCVSCGVPADAWQPICPACGAFDGMILEPIHRQAPSDSPFLPVPLDKALTASSRLPGSDASSVPSIRLPSGADGRSLPNASTAGTPTQTAPQEAEAPEANAPKAGTPQTGSETSGSAKP